MIRRMIAAVIAIGVLSGGRTFGQSEEDAVRPFLHEFGPGARALAMGGAYAALAEDYTAVYWNPAGLAQIRKMEFAASLSHTRINNEIGYYGTVADNTNGFTKFNSVGMVFPVPTYRGSLVFAVGYNRVGHYDDFSEVIGWAPLSTGGRFYQSERTTVDGGLNQWAFSGAVDLTRSLSVGATLNLLVGGDNTAITYLEDDQEDVLTSEIRTVDIGVDKDFTGVSLKAGALGKPTENLRIAVTATTPQRVVVEERSTLYDYLRYDDGVEDPISDDSYRKYTIYSPWKFEIGASYKYRLATVSSTLEFLDWTESEFRSNIVDDEGRDIDGDLNASIRKNYRSVVNVRMGGEVLVPALGVKAMAGYATQTSPLKTSVESVNSNRQYLSGGVSFLLDKQVKIDLAYQYGWWKQSTVDDLLGQDDLNRYYSTSEKIRTNRLLLSLSYRF